MKVIAKTKTEMEGIVADFVAKLRPLRDRALVVTLSGDLGAGKTAFTKGAAKGLGIADEITSPTFVIEKIYKIQNSFFSHFIHIDAYRLQGGEELAVLGWKGILSNPSNLIFVEWPEQVSSVLPADAVALKFAFVEENVREIIFPKSDV